MPYYQLSRKVSGIQAIGGNSSGNTGGNTGGDRPCKGDHNSGSIYNYQGKVHTGYYQNWKGLSKEDRKTVIVAREKNNSKSSQNTIKKYVSDTKRQISKLL